MREKNVINIKKVGTIKNTHPTEKPKELYEWLLRRYCKHGGTVLDPTAGSFNSIKVAKELGLKGIGIEMDNNFFANSLKYFCKSTVDGTEEHSDKQFFLI
jgi:DNA modification methylase